MFVPHHLRPSATKLAIPRVQPKSFSGPMTQNLIARWENMRVHGVYKRGVLVRQGTADFVRWTKEQIRREELAEFMAEPQLVNGTARQFVPSTSSLRPKVKAGRPRKPPSHPPYHHQVRAEVKNRMDFTSLTRGQWRAAWVEHCRLDPMSFDAFKRMRLTASLDSH